MMRFLLAVLLWCALPLAGQQSPDLDGKLSPMIAGMLRSSGAPSVSVAVVDQGRLVYAKAFGMADIEKSRAADTSTRYAVGSVSKQFTAVALLMLQEEGRLSLDDKVSKYFPEFTRTGDITIRQLLAHTSGYEDYAPQDYFIPAWKKPTAPMDLLAHWANKPLNFEPGTEWQYSNTNYVLAAAIFEKVSGQKLVPFLAERVFRPLGMNSAGDCQSRDAADASGYTRYAAGPPRPAAREGDGWYFGAAGLCMTAPDLARWNIAAFIEKKVLSPRSYDEFTREVKLSNGGSTRYALGLQLGEFRGMRRISHTGEVSGFLASNSVFPDRGAAIVVLSNADGADLIGHLPAAIARLVFAPDPPLPADSETGQIRLILEGLAAGRIDRALFTDNANSYFTETALGDYRDSLAPLGELKSVTRTSESRRGGMIYRSYSAVYDRRTVRLSVYVTPEGKYEQFLAIFAP
ncbi:MAG: serine hydrolase domain-containing protein [bacterium]|jgi:D-alanyl-D-alanine carboxypeptidase